MKLRERLASPDILIVPGGGSPLEIKLIEHAGFDVAYLSGYATAAARYAVPDIGLMGFAEVLGTVQAVRQVTEVALIADCDTGYGDVINVRHTVQSMERLGVAAIQLEDQIWPKRCGHMDDKIVEPRDVAVRKVRAAVTARTNPATVIIARTDARGPHGLDEALERCRMFHDAGADVVFVDGPQSLDDLERIGKESPGFVMANMSETGKTPLLGGKELQQLGFDLVIFPTSAIRIAIASMDAFFRDLKATSDSRHWVDRMASLAETNTILDMDAMRDFQSRMLDATP